ncbi:sigma 54-interacting transcriptional regulator [Dethiosulfatibacter aminovorans]|nr:sigma 54-interacting transcriptional regulator [Dethiosulfatibacter aminovorans]
MMLNRVSKTIYDALSEGIVLIDSEERIQLINNAAREIFGFMDTGTIDHPEGKLEEGDIVCIATNSLGADDGYLNAEVLRKLGFRGKIEYGHSFVIAGKYLFEDMDPYCIHEHVYSDIQDYSIEFENIFFNVVIDDIDKYIEIGYGEESYRLDYFYAISNMIVVDGKTGKLKFVQSLGYTSRKETPRELLEGNPFRGKGRYYRLRELIGRKISEVFQPNSTMEALGKVAGGEAVDYVKKFDKFNNMPTLCSIKPIDGGKIKGAILIVENLSNIERAMKEKDYVLTQLNKLQKSIGSGSGFVDKFPAIIGRSGKIRQVKEMAGKASGSNSNLLILGESGTGKSLLAREIHENSPRGDFPFISINCSSIPENLLESELFGYEQGAFTGASRKGKKGMFELAHEGTIFLDEIGDMNIYLQAKLLKIIQEKRFFRLGGDREIEVDVRVIAATNISLENAVKEGRFRKDLYYRLNVLSINMPSLREMKDDIELLVEKLLPKACIKAGVDLKNVSHSALSRLKAYSFPGNIRELENILERAVNLTHEEIITSDSLIFENESVETRNVFRDLKYYAKEAEKRVIIEALIFYDYDLKSVMKDLNIKKSSLYNKIKEYDINIVQKNGNCSKNME